MVDCGGLWYFKQTGTINKQIDYVLLWMRFQELMSIGSRIIPGADIGRDYDLVMMTFLVRLKKTEKPTQSRPRFDLEKLRNPDVAVTF